MNGLFIKTALILAGAELIVMAVLPHARLAKHPAFMLADPLLMLLLAMGPLGLLLRAERKKLDKQKLLDTKLHVIIGKLWNASSHTISTETLLNSILREILENSPISIQKKGAIFLKEGNDLVLKSSIGFGDEQKLLCGTIPPGRCLCGAALESGKTVYSGAIDDRHHIRPAGMPPHGHYCLPISSGGAVIGAITLYLDPGHLRDQEEEAFLASVCAIIARIIEGKQLERSLFQMHKMDALNRFAAGIAHDFNNILSAISGYCSVAARQLPPENPCCSDLGDITAAVEKGTALTRQLKLFSRQSAEAMETADLNPLLKASCGILSRLLGPQIALVFSPADSPLPVKCNRTQIDQAIMNLAVNAKDAMPKGGRITVKAAPDEICLVDSRQCFKAAKITVSDTGEGIEEALLEKIFEPFFTTKSEEKGSGLGLAIVHGIIRQHGGEILVRSKPGKGTTFDIYLPLETGSSPE